MLHLKEVEDKLYKSFQDKNENSPPINYDSGLAKPSWQDA